MLIVHCLDDNSLLGVLIIGTGIHGDDLTEIIKMSSMSWVIFNLDPNIHGHYVFGIPTHFILFWAYKVLTLVSQLPLNF